MAPPKVCYSSVWSILTNKSTKNTLFLLAQRSDSVNNSGLWNVFGGRVDFGERVEVAAARELREESKLKPSLNFIGSRPHNKDTFNYFHADMPSLIEPKLNDENDTFKWFCLVEVLKLDLHIPTKIFFQHFVLPFVKL
jgi:8-oxo-dGTP diphosphatase